MQFNEYLKYKRICARLTQAELSARLGESSSILQGVDANTVSRWERNLSTPTKERQKAIVLFFEDDPNQKMPFKPSLAKTTEDLNAFIYKQIEKQRFDSLVGSLPKLPSSMEIHQNKNEVDTNQLQFLIDFDYDVLGTDAPIGMENLKGWLASNRSEYWHAYQYGQLAMHFLALNISESITKDVLTMRRYESSIQNDDLVDDGDMSTFHIVSTWATNREAIVESLIALYRHLHKNRETIKNVTTIAGNNDGLKLANLFGLKPVYFSEPITTQSQREGITLNNKKYAWVSFQADISDVLCRPIANHSIASQ